MASETRDDVGGLSYEEARDQLIGVVNELEQDSSTLEESLALWERGEALAQRCEEWLRGAKARLEAARGAAVGGTLAAPGAAAQDPLPTGSATAAAE